MTVTLDTLAIYERLIQANVDEKAAREFSEIFRENAEKIVEQQKEELATKNDLEKAKVEMIKWIAGMLVAQAAVVATLVKLLS